MTRQPCAAACVDNSGSWPTTAGWRQAKNDPETSTVRLLAGR
jgi:hypothetical protein